MQQKIGLIIGNALATYIQSIKEGQLIPPTHKEDEDFDPLVTTIPPTAPSATTDDPNEGNLDNMDICVTFTDSPEFWNGQLSASPMTDILTAQLISSIRPHTAA